jgi:hypothetical protein
MATPEICRYDFNLSIPCMRESAIQAKSAVAARDDNPLEVYWVVYCNNSTLSSIATITHAEKFRCALGW